MIDKLFLIYNYRSLHWDITLAFLLFASNDVRYFMKEIYFQEFIEFC